MISSEKGLIIKSIGNIKDPDLQREYLLKVKDIMIKKRKLELLEKKIIIISTKSIKDMARRKSRLFKIYKRK